MYVIQVAGMEWVHGAWLGPQWDSYIAIAIIHGNKIPFQVTLITSNFNKIYSTQLYIGDGQNSVMGGGCGFLNRTMSADGEYCLQFRFRTLLFFDCKIKYT